MTLSINKNRIIEDIFKIHLFCVNQLLKVNEVKDIGVVLDFLLNLNYTLLRKKTNRMIGLIKRNVNYLDKNTFLTLYKALVRPHLEYAQWIWTL